MKLHAKIKTNVRHYYREQKNVFSLAPNDNSDLFFVFFIHCSINFPLCQQKKRNSVRVFQFLLDHTETGSWNKQKIMEIFVEKNELGSLQEVLNRGWLRGASALEKLLDYAHCAQKPEVVALLLEYSKVN